MEGKSHKLISSDPNHLHHLIIYVHPNPHSLSAAYRDEVARISVKAGSDLIIRDLYEIGFDPVLRGSDFTTLQEGKIPDEIAIEQGYLKWADLITFIYPIWWGAMPAMMKGYCDRVLQHGFAYEITEKGNVIPLLIGKKVILLNNMGQSYEIYKKSGILDAIQKITDTNTFAFCGMEILEHHFFGSAASAPREQLAAYIHTLETIYWKYLYE